MGSDEYGRLRRLALDGEGAARDAEPGAPWPGKRARTDLMQAPGRAGDGGLQPGAQALLIAADASPGAGLPGALRGRLEASLGADLDAVRVHTGAASAVAAQTIGAVAYTTGQDIHFGAGAYAPGSAAGDSLIAHEVAHTVQQRGAAVDVRQEKLEVSAPGDAHEVEAEDFARSFAAGDVAAMTPVSRGSVSRMIISRAPPTAPAASTPFDPQLIVALAPAPAPVLNGDVVVKGSVANAAQLPEGQQLTWKLFSLPSDAIDSHAASPATGPSTTWTHRPKKVTDFTLAQGVYAGAGSGGLGEGKRAEVGFKVPTPEVVWGTVVTPGNTGKTLLGGNRERTDTGVGAAKLYRNDQVTFTAELSKVAHAKDAGIDGLYEQSGALGTMSSAAWKGASTLQWTLTANQPGKLTVTPKVQIPGVAAELSSAFQFKVVMDLTDLMMTCQAASELIQTKFHGASARLIEAKQAYERAHKKHKDAIKDAHAVGELVGELLIGAFFAALGGAAGGAVGNVIKNKLTADFSKVVADSALGGAITDGGKDTAKFAVRALSRLGGGGAGATTETPGSGASGGGTSSGAGEDPIAWSETNAKRLNGEAAMLHGKLAAVIDRARNADRDTEFDDFDGDPVQAINNDETLTSLLTISTDELQYAKALWHTWLSNYAYSVSVISDHLIEGKSVQVQDNVSSKIRTKINEVAASVGESGEVWINTYGAKAWLKAKHDADMIKQNPGYNPAAPENQNPGVP